MKQNRPYLNALYHCCGRKVWAASAQSFTLCQQATTEITFVVTISKYYQLFTSFTNIYRCHSPRSLYYSLLLVQATYIWAGFFKDPNRGPRIENRVPRIRENYHRIPRIRENRVSRISCWKRNRVPTDPYRVAYLTFSSKKLYMGVILRAHHVHNESHIQRNTNQEVSISLWALSCL